MYKLCKTEQSALRQRQIEDALLEMMAVRSYDDITVSDLCRCLGMPRKAFYRYFSGKEGALFAMLDHRLMEYDAGSVREGQVKHFRFSLDLQWFFEFWLRQKPLLDALERSGISGILVERAITHSREALIFEIPGRSREYVDASTDFTVCGLMSMVIHWHHGGYLQSVEQMAHLACKMLSTPLVPGLDE